MNKVTLARIRTMAQAAAGSISHVYVHWTAGHYGQTFADYHILVDKDGTLYASVDDLTTHLSHTYMRNTGAVAIAAMCAYQAVSTSNLGPEPPTDAQIDAIAQVMAVFSLDFGLTVDIKYFMTHAEAADNMDGLNPGYEPNGYPDGKYGPANSVERWDFWVVQAGDEPGSGGDCLREKAIGYKGNLISLGGSAMRKYLLKKDSPDLRDHIYYSAVYKAPEHLPAKVDLREQCSPVVDQGQLGSCTANAIASGLREYLLLKNKEVWVALSRLFLYWEERYLEGTVNEDSGAEIRDGMKVLNTIGVCPESDWPYDISTFTNPPDEQDIIDAAAYKIKEYHRIGSLPQLKAALAEGLPVVIGIEVYDSFEADSVSLTGLVPVPDPTRESLLGGHAVLVVGYDDSKEYLIVRNSWGTSWGDAGYCYIPYAFYTGGYMMDLWTSAG